MIARTCRLRTTRRASPACPPRSAISTSPPAPRCCRKACWRKPAANLMSLGDTGVGVMEHSHRGKPRSPQVIERAEATDPQDRQHPGRLLRPVFAGRGEFAVRHAADELPARRRHGGLPDDRLLEQKGRQGGQAVRQRSIEACSSEPETNFDRIPTAADDGDVTATTPRTSTSTSNNTIFGTQFVDRTHAAAGDAFLACDASSDIFSRPLDVSKYGLIYAGAQKNLGSPAASRWSILRDGPAGPERCREVPSMLNYKTLRRRQAASTTPRRRSASTS